MIHEEGKGTTTTSGVANEERFAQSGPGTRSLVRLLLLHRHRANELFTSLYLLEFDSLVPAKKHIGLLARVQQRLQLLIRVVWKDIALPTHSFREGRRKKV